MPFHGVDSSLVDPAGRWIAGAGAAGALCDGRLGFLYHVSEHHLHGGHLLPDADGPVPLATVVGPLEPAHAPVVAARTLLHGGLCRVPQQPLDAVEGPGGPLGRRGHPSAQIGLERLLVYVAEIDGLACDLDHDLVIDVIPEEEDQLRAVQKPVYPLVPQRSVVLVPPFVRVLDHGGRTEEECADVVRELVWRNVCAVIFNSSAIVDPVVTVDEIDPCHPIPSPDGPVGIRAISGIESKACSQVEEACLRYGILVIKAVVPCKYLPAQPTIAILRVPARCLRVENRLS